MLDKDGNNSPHARWWIGEKACLETADTGVSMNIARLDITTGLPERDLPTKFILQMVSGETLSHFEESFSDTDSGSVFNNKLGVHHQ
jgi:hypothetical protein